MTATTQAPQKRRFTFPSAFTILALITAIVALLTYIIPAGRYATDPDGAPIPGTYQIVEQNPATIQDVLLAPINGMYGIQDAEGHISTYNRGDLYGAIDVALFILVIGGFLGITMKTGAIDAGIAPIVKRLGDRGRLLIPILMIIFAAGGTSYGMAEESLAFYPLIIAALIALGYDALTGVAVIMLGAGIGVMGSTVNPFATGIASGFAGIPISEGIVLRIIILAAGTALGIWYVMRYASRVKNDPTKSRVADMAEANRKHFLREQAQSEAPAFTTRRKVIIGLFALAFLIMIVGVIPWADIGIQFVRTRYWWFGELTAVFMVMAFIIGIVGRMNEQELVSNFVDGVRDMAGVALVVALARGISVIMTNGLIIDTVLHACEQALGGLGPVPFVNVIYLLYLPLSFLIPSSSGLATVTMPIMSPLAQFQGVPESVVVTAYQTASGLLNLFTPTFAVVTGALLIGRVPFSTWWRFVLPLVLILGVMTMILLSLATIILVSAT